MKLTNIPKRFHVYDDNGYTFCPFNTLLKLEIYAKQHKFIVKHNNFEKVRRNYCNDTYDVLIEIKQK